MMKLVIALAFLASSGVAHAETWIAKCNGIQLNFMREAKSYILYFATSSGIYQMGVGKIAFDNGSALRGPMVGNPLGFQGQSLTEIGLNPSRQLVYVLYRHPTTGEIKSGDFCNTEILIR